jgi:hypothetical protein
MKDLLGLGVVFDGPDTVQLLFRLLMVVTFTAIVIRGAYSRRNHSTDHVFTYWLFSLVTFSICFLLRKVPMELGFALGLFAVFGVLRYRTESIAIKDLTYLFIVIGIALVNSLANKKITFVELLIVNVVITGATYLLEGRGRGQEGSLLLTYDRVDRLAPNQRQDLLAELSKRLDLPLTRLIVHEADMLKDTARISVFYSLTDKEGKVVRDES